MLGYVLEHWKDKMFQYEVAHTETLMWLQISPTSKLKLPIFSPPSNGKGESTNALNSINIIPIYKTNKTYKGTVQKVFILKTHKMNKKTAG